MNPTEKYQILGLNYVSMYAKDLEAALSWYSSLFGDPINDFEGIYGWKLGATYLTLLASRMGTHPDSNPRNAEYAIHVATPDMVDQLYNDLIAAGATNCMEPNDGRMYEPMRFAAVDDPFGMRIDIYCPI